MEEGISLLASGTDGSTNFVGTTRLCLLTSENEPCHVDTRGDVTVLRLRVNVDDNCNLLVSEAPRLCRAPVKHFFLPLQEQLGIILTILLH